MTPDLVPVTQPGDRLAGLVAAFLESRESPHTARGYQTAITSWLDWCGRNNVDPLNAVPAQGQLWIAGLRDVVSDATRATRQSAVSSWYEWLDEQGVDFRRNPARWKSGRTKANSKPTAALSVEQRNAILVMADNEHRHRNPQIAHHGLRNSAIVWTLFTTGIRVAEVLSADVEGLAQDAGHRVLHLITKGRKRHTALLNAPTWDRIEAYRAARDDSDRLPTTTVGARPRRPLFTTDTGRRLTPNAVRAILRRLAKDAGLPAEVVAEISPHVTRATYITLSLAAGRPLQVVQKAVGHANPKTTQGYDRTHLAYNQHPSYALMADLPTDTTAPR